MTRLEDAIRLREQGMLKEARSLLIELIRQEPLDSSA